MCERLSPEAHLSHGRIRRMSYIVLWVLTWPKEQSLGGVSFSSGRETVEPDSPFWRRRTAPGQLKSLGTDAFIAFMASLKLSKACRIYGCIAIKV